MAKETYIIGFKNELGRGLTNISSSGINFNISMHMEFETPKAVVAFAQRWKNYRVFNLFAKGGGSEVAIVKKIERKNGTDYKFHGPLPEREK